MHIMERSGLSKTHFAEKIGVSQPVLTHISTGRNKASLEIVQKLREAFPDINLVWLLSGEGEMYTARKQDQLEQAGILTEALLYRISQAEEQLAELKKAAQHLAKSLK